MTEPNEVIPTIEPSPPKYPAPPPGATSSFTRSIISLLLYLLAGYWLFGSLETLLLITFILMLHETGHFLAMRAVGYRDLGIFFIPLIGAYVSGAKRTVTQRESALVILAGPLPGLLIGTILWQLIKIEQLPPEILELDLKQLAIFLVILNGLNLLPIFPLDGGQLLNRVFLDEEGWISRIFLIASAIFLGTISIHYRIYPLLIFPIILLMRLYRSPQAKRIEKRIEQAGINTELEYDELPDADYWKIRNILIEEHPACRAWAGEYLDTYSPEEGRIRQLVEDQLHRTLVHDLSTAAKFAIALIWLTGLVMPLVVWLR